ncbi:hypothetical protein SteCoe_19593 [Stentor coeruleus]|uniref:G-protein coupled receptors family 2 profile 2 domain-containing protein n=1 Tax=Stentor coeruleus TaxID=5963 RepID=A0A1R2BUF6_9CILI|nr:hypothetical protein SteCoe_19593 [Stentor coeruleus]
MDMQENSMHLFLVATSALSLFSSCFMALIYIGYKSLRSYILSLVLLMLFGNAVKSVGVFISTNNIACGLPGYLYTTGALSGLAWSAIISYTIYEAHVINENIFVFRKTYLIIGFVIPLIMGAFPFITDSYNYGEGYCFINSDHPEKWIWRGFCLYMPVIIVTVFNYRKYRKVIEAIEYDIEMLPDKSMIMSSQNKYARKLLLYPFVVFLCYFPSIICLPFEIAFNVPDAVILVCRCLECLFGFFNTLLYAFTPKILDAVKKTIFCQKNQDSGGSNNNCTVDEDWLRGTFLRDYSELN